MTFGQQPQGGNGYNQQPQNQYQYNAQQPYAYAPNGTAAINAQATYACEEAQRISVTKA